MDFFFLVGGDMDELSIQKFLKDQKSENFNRSEISFIGLILQI